MVRPASRLSNAGSQEDLGGQNTLGDQAAGAMAPATAGVEALRTVGRAPTILRSPTRARWVAAPVGRAASWRRECQGCCYKELGHGWGAQAPALQWRSRGVGQTR